MSDKEEKPRTKSLTECEFLPRFKDLWNKYCKNCGDKFMPGNISCILGHNVGCCYRGCYIDCVDCLYKSPSVKIRIIGREALCFSNYDYDYVYEVKLHGEIVYSSENQ